jgi:glycosyltransferase involved in cell wall biosynthesis
MSNAVISNAVIVVPCFNEARRLRVEGFADLVRDGGVRLLFVDDGSRDDTLRVLRSICTQLGPRRAALLALEENGGKAEAVRRGLLRAIEDGASRVGFLDADLATPGSEMLRLLATLDESGAQAVLAARVALLGTTIERKAWRHYLGRIFATAASLILDLRVYDTQCGAKAFRSSDRLASALARPFNARWAFDVELIGRLLIGVPGRAGLSARDFVEMPLRSWTDVPDSKLGLADFPSLGIELLRVFFALRAERRAAQSSVPSTESDLAAMRSRDAA